ncbi:MAG: hypothetical protein RR162_07335, partial [Oscillospiraceae bacterium]
YVKTVGSENRNNTSLTVQNMWYLKTGNGEEKQFDPRANARDTAEVQKQIDGVNTAVESIKSPDGPFKTPADKAAALKKAILMKSQLNHKLEDLQKQLSAFEKGKDKSSLRIICPGTIYSGGKITIDRYVMRVEHAITNQKIYPEGGELVYGTIFPHEKDIN